MSSNQYFYILNNIIYFFIYFFTHTYFKKLQITILNLFYQIPPKSCYNWTAIFARASAPALTFLWQLFNFYWKFWFIWVPKIIINWCIISNWIVETLGFDDFAVEKMVRGILIFGFVFLLFLFKTYLDLN